MTLKLVSNETVKKRFNFPTLELHAMRTRMKFARKIIHQKQKDRFFPV